MVILGWKSFASLLLEQSVLSLSFLPCKCYKYFFFYESWNGHIRPSATTRRRMRWMRPKEALVVYLFIYWQCIIVCRHEWNWYTPIVKRNGSGKRNKNKGSLILLANMIFTWQIDGFIQDLWRHLGKIKINANGMLEMNSHCGNMKW